MSGNALPIPVNSMPAPHSGSGRAPLTDAYDDLGSTRCVFRSFMRNRLENPASHNPNRSTASSANSHTPQISCTTVSLFKA